jgi:hypothetical protein
VRCYQPVEQSGAPGGLPAPERNRYFDGKFMTARDFQADPDYFLSRHRLHQRLLHGWGVVCGLHVRHHPRPTSCKRWVVVTSGIAIDCYGRELVLQQDTAFELPLPRAEEGRADGCDREDETLKEPFFVCLRYTEQPVEQVPVLYHEGQCDPTRKEANRVRESATIVIRTGDQFEPDCWRQPDGGMQGECVDDCDEELPVPGGTCLEPGCPCGDTVPLARITPDPDEGFEIHTEGRRELPAAPQPLTHIAGTNWRHGETVTLGDLRQWEGQLRVRFDRRLLPPPPREDATGINEYTFLVEWGNLREGERDVLQYDPEHPPRVEDDSTAVFTIHPDYYRRRHDTIAGTTVFVTLRCDFILDCHDNPVDGTHLRGRLPSGDGTPGGRFESWFHVAYQRERPQEEA